VDAHERALIDECLAGHAEAFGDLIKPYQDRLYNTLFRILGSREDAAETLQDALIRAYRRLSSFHHDSSFYTWLYRVAVNLALTRRQNRRENTRSLSEKTNEVIAENTRPGQNLEADERRQLIEKALAGVPEVFRVALVLKEIEGMKYEEIAQILNLPIGTVRSRLHRARQEMRQRLQPLIDAGVL
jgi:RNA polymerase sigma-70 factor (ECF subfamily)